MKLTIRETATVSGIRDAGIRSLCLLTARKRGGPLADATGEWLTVERGLRLN